MFACRSAVVLGIHLLCNSASAWPMLRSSPDPTGYVDVSFQLSFQLKWAVEVSGERIGTAVEPIVADGKVFITTHSGNLYALDQESGKALWKFTANGPFLHSPAYAEGSII